MTAPVGHELVDDIGVITVDNPPVNALSQAVRQGLHDAIHAAQHDTSKVLLIVCSGRTFIAGADITEFGKPAKEPHLPDLCNTIEASSKPVVAAIHGTALGGGLEVALSCHYRCAVAGAKVGLPEVKLGLLPGAGGTQRLPRLIGVSNALDMMTGGNPVGAAAAAQLGLVDHVADGDPGEAGLAWCRELAAQEAEPRVTSERQVDRIPDSVFADYRKVLQKRARGQIAPQKIVDRLLFALVNEGMNILDEGIAQRPRDIDVVYVYGYGFPAWRGGPMFYADAVGLAQVHERVCEFERRFGSGNWTPAPLLERLVEADKTLADWAKSQVN
jgi:3-hydroxyacyl-CoA dehydrogenase